MVNAPVWADDKLEASIDLASHVFAAVESTGARALRDDEMGELRGGFLGGILDALPETNTVLIQDGDNPPVSSSGDGLQSVTVSRPGFSATATANSSSSSSTSSFSGSSFRFD